MKKIILLLLLILLILPLNLFAYRFVGLGFGPNIGLRGIKKTSYFLNADWTPHKYFGTRFVIGFVNGFWIGTALTFQYSTSDKFAKYWNWAANFSIPFIFNIKQDLRRALIGFTIGNSFSFSLDRRRKYYLYISPLEFMFIPFTWDMYSRGGSSSDFKIFLMWSVGFRVRL